MPWEDGFLRAVSPSSKAALLDTEREVPDYIGNGIFDTASTEYSNYDFEEFSSCDNDEACGYATGRAEYDVEVSRGIFVEGCWTLCSINSRNIERWEILEFPYKALLVDT